MSENNEIQPLALAHQDIPRMEPWIIAMLIAFVPLLFIFILPRGVLTWVCLGATAIAAAVGIVMLIRSELSKNR